MTVCITFVQYKVMAFVDVLASISPKLVPMLTLGPVTIPKFGSVEIPSFEIPTFGLLAGVILFGSILFMKKDGKGNRMR